MNNSGVSSSLMTEDRELCQKLFRGTKEAMALSAIGASSVTLEPNSSRNSTDNAGYSRIYNGEF